MQEKVVLAFIGNGKSTNRYHLPFVLNRPDKFKVKTIYQRTAKNRGWAAIEGVNYTTNFDDVLKDEEIDVVVVCTSTESHYAVAKQVLLAGKNCVVEKPFSTSYENAKELFDIAEEKGVMVQCYQNRRFDSDFLTVQRVIKSGVLGQVFEIDMCYDYYRAYVPEGQAEYTRDSAFIFTHACHTVDQVLSVFGKPDNVVSDVRQLLGKGRMNDYMDLDMFYGNMKVSVKASYFRAKPRPSFSVYGTKGTFIKAEQDRQEADLKKFYLPAGHDDFGLDLPEHFGTLVYYDDAGVYHEEKVPTEKGDYALYYDALYETIKNVKPQLVKKNDTLEQMRILEQCARVLEG